MGDILGIGTTHYPPGLVPDEYKPWPLARMLHGDPRIPDHLRDPASWPEPMRAEWGNDEGITSFKAHRTRVFSSFRTLRDEIVAFRPDFILMWGDDQYENFKEDVIPPFCVLAYDTLTFQPFKRLGNRPNIWGEPADKTFTWPGQPAAGRFLASRLLAAGVDMPSAYLPLERLEASGQHEVLNWVCLAGAMAELGTKMELVDWVETWIFNAPKCQAIFR